MKIIRFLFCFIITTSIILILDRQWGSIPPIGKLLSPHHGFWQNAESIPIGLPSTILLDKIQQEVVVQFDNDYIPHIYASNDDDLFFVQGYITAYHRLWQMEFQLLATEGRISEIINSERIFNFDRHQRRKSLKYAAKKMNEELENHPIYLKLLKQYTDGVNAYISSLTPSEIPIEYKLLNYKPEEWSVFKTCLLMKEMADQLSRGEADLENTNTVKIWGKEIFDQLFPEAFEDIDPVIPKGSTFNFEPLGIERPNTEFISVYTQRKIKKPNKQNGSNSFAVNGKKSKDGSVLFANEPDLGLNAPSLWYLVHLNSPSYNVMGGSLPGAPGIVIGFNDSIAFGDTNAKRDLVDWYKIEFKNDKRLEYKYDNNWLKTEKIIEEIKVRGESSYFDTILYTHYGPVVYDRNFTLNKEKTNMAMKWTAHDASVDFITFFKLNKAKNYDDFLNAYSYYTGPPQNVTFASAHGDIAIKIAGKFPIKWGEQGKFIMDGSDSRFEWQKYMPYEHVLETINPKRNFISSANQHPVDNSYPYYHYDYNFEYYRNRRINERLKTMHHITPRDMMLLQNDNFNYIAYEILPLMLDSLTNNPIKDQPKYLAIIEDLNNWDYFSEAEFSAPTVFELWFSSLYDLTWDEFENQGVSLIKPNKFTTIRLMNDNPYFAFFDIIETPKKESLGDLIRESFQIAMNKLNDWKLENGEDYSWYLFKNTTIQHLTRSLKTFSFEKIKIGGYSHIVNAASEKHGPSLRLVVRLDDKGTEAWAIYPGSQSGNPGNPTYGNMIEDWADMNYIKLNFKNTPLSEDLVLKSLTIKPLLP